MKKFIPSQNSPNANKLVKESKGKVSQNRRNINFCYWIKLHIKSKHRFSNFHLSKRHITCILMNVCMLLKWAALFVKGTTRKSKSKAVKKSLTYKYFYYFSFYRRQNLCPKSLSSWKRLYKDAWKYVKKDSIDGRIEVHMHKSYCTMNERKGFWKKGRWGRERKR